MVGVCVPIEGRIPVDISMEGMDVVVGEVVPIEENERTIGMLEDIPGAEGAPLPDGMLVVGRLPGYVVLPRGTVLAVYGILLGVLVLDGVVEVVGSQFLNLFPQSGQINSAQETLGG